MCYQDAYNVGAYEDDAYLNEQYSTEEDYDDVSNAGTYANFMPNVSTQVIYSTIFWLYHIGFALMFRHIVYGQTYAVLNNQTNNLSFNTPPLWNNWNLFLNKIFLLKLLEIQNGAV